MKVDFAAVVRRHWKHTVGYLVAGSEPCITISRDEMRNVKRRLGFVGLRDAPPLAPTGSWFMAVIVCKGDDLAGLAEWATGQDARRVHSYLHKDAKPRHLAPWRDAGLPLTKIEEGLSTWQTLHKLLGWDLNVQVYDDHVEPSSL